MNKSIAIISFTIPITICCFSASYYFIRKMEHEEQRKTALLYTQEVKSIIEPVGAALEKVMRAANEY